MKIFIKRLGIYSFILGMTVTVIPSCTEGFLEINENPYETPYDPGTDGSGSLNTTDISMPDTITADELARLKENESTIGQVFKSFTYQGLVDDYQRSTNLTHDIYAGYFANNNTNFVNNSPNYVYTQDWSARRWDHFYKDRSAEYKTLVNTFYYVDREKYKNAFYMTRIYYAFLASTMTDTYGEMPFGVYVQGKAAPEKCPYNTQEEIYDMIFRMLTEAADSIKPGQCSFHFADREDKCYNGDEAKWIRFANTLRLRLALRISNVAPDRARKEGVAALNHPGGIMTSQDDRMRTVPNYAPIEMGGEDDSGLENEVANCGFRYGDVVMSKDIEQAYKNLGSELDPRCTICWYRPTPKNFLEIGREMNTDYNGCYIGSDTISHETNVYSPLKCNHHEGKVLNDNYWFGYCREYIWLGYAECKFLLAEASLREWTYAYGSVEELFKEGIRESFNYYNMPDSAEAYINRLNIYNGKEENPFDGNDKEAQLEQIITQKWLAVFPNGNEGWAEFRRTDYPRLNNHKANKDPNIPNGKFIKRVGYSTDEYAYNIDNVPQNVNQSTRVWWDVEDTNNENGERNTPNNFRGL